MIRVALWLLASLVLAGIVHIVTVLALPAVATRSAYARLLPIAPANQVVLLPEPRPEGVALPFMDPAFATAICRFDLTAGPLKLQMQVALAYTSATFYTRDGAAFYAINDRAAAGRMLELELMTTQQRERVRTDEEVTPADRLIVESPVSQGLIALRALAPEPGAMTSVRANLAAARCTPQRQ